MTPRKLLTREYLEEHYVRQAKSLGVIARELGIASDNSVLYYIKKFGLERKPQRNSKEKLTKEYLEEHYVRQQKGIRQIAREIGVRSRGTIRKMLVRHGIEIREEFVRNDLRQLSWSKKRTGYGEMSGRFWASLVNNAKVRCIHFDLDPEWLWSLFLSQGRRCSLSGVPIRFNLPGEKQTSTTASLDRIDSTVGYVVGNVHWVHKKVQRMKWAYSQEEFIEMCGMVTKHATRKNSAGNISEE